MISRPYPVSQQLTDAIGLLLLCVVVGMPILALAYWMRFDAPIWMAFPAKFIIGGWF